MQSPVTCTSQERHRGAENGIYRTSRMMIKVLALFLLVSSMIYVVLMVVYMTNTRKNRNGYIPRAAQLLKRNRTFAQTSPSTSQFKPVARSKTFLILDWSEYSNVGQTKKTGYVTRNCIVTRQRDPVTMSKADVVLTTINYNKHAVPPQRWRHPAQRWILLFDDTPHLFNPIKQLNIRKYDNIFNWTMGWSSKADVHFPYGYFYRLNETRANLFNWRRLFSQKKKILYAMASNCDLMFNGRLSYMRRLQVIMNKKSRQAFEFYGKCGQLKCSGRYKHQCEFAGDYKFYLAFENSNCSDYITEKLWINAFHNDVVPIVMGPSRANYEKYIPAKSFIHVSDFKTPEALADYVFYLDKNETAYREYFDWKKTFGVVSRMQYVGDFIWELLCDRLNADDGSVKFYKKLDEIFHPSHICSSRNYKVR